MALTNTLLLALCANWPPSNITVSSIPPPWKWSKFFQFVYVFHIIFVKSVPRLNN